MAIRALIHVPADGHYESEGPVFIIDEEHSIKDVLFHLMSEMAIDGKKELLTILETM
jgi:hypothetical protein